LNALPYRWRVLVASLACLYFSNLVATPAHAGATGWIDIKVSHGHLLVESEVAGISGYSVIDTGAQLNAINEAFIEAQELSFKKARPVKIRGVVGESLRSTYREIPVVVFGAALNFKRLVELDLGSPDIQLILGASFIENYVFQFDYPNARLRLITRDSVDLEAIKNVESKKDPEGGSPLVKVGLSEDTDAWLTMDTGATGGILIDRDLATRLDWVDTYPKLESTVSGVISSGQMEHFNVPSVQLGAFKIEKPIVSIPVFGESFELFETYTPLGTRIASRSSSKGLLGYNILKHFVVTVDYKAGHVHIYPGEKEVDEQQTVD
jgi:predicted aspartyl protease